MSRSGRRASATPTAAQGRQPNEAPARLPRRRQQTAALAPPGPLRSVTSTRITPLIAVLTATVTVSPGAPEPLYRRLLENNSLASKAATSPHGCPGPSAPSTNARASRARSARPASVTVSRITRPAISAPAFPAASLPRIAGRWADTPGWTLDSTANVKARRPRNGHRNPQRAAINTAPWPRFSSAMCPWTPQHRGLQRYAMTHDGAQQNGPPAREFAANGP
jgi:hypothetical protein